VDIVKAAVGKDGDNISRGCGLGEMFEDLVGVGKLQSIPVAFGEIRDQLPA